MKNCIKCNLKKPLESFYKHKGMSDGHLNKCKDCIKSYTKKRQGELMNDPEWYEKEKKRHRDKYYRLGYKDKHKPSKENKREIMLRHREKYPEKVLAKNRCSKIPVPENFERHHWSYKKEHAKDIIALNKKEHAKIHRYLDYDQKEFKYRVKLSGELLATREMHENFINKIID